MPLLAALLLTSSQVSSSNPVVTTSNRIQPHIIEVIPRGTFCSDIAVKPIYSPNPSPAVVLPYRVKKLRDIVQQSDGVLTVEFDIDERGIPINIRSSLEPGSRNNSLFILKDFVPAIAAWKFRSSNGATNCSTTFDIEMKTVSETDKAVLYQLHRRDIPKHSFTRKQIYQNLISTGSNCHKGRRPAMLSRHLPDFGAIDTEPGARDHVFFNHDIDATGKVINIKIVGSSGNKEFENAAKEALAKNSYSTATIPERVGCNRSYRLGSKRVIEHPKPDWEKSSAESCSGLPEDWEKSPKISYPTNFRRRKIEGWAELQYDVAPWGQVSNVSILRAQPSLDIGLTAQTSFRYARKPKSDRGFSGCTEIVRFEIRKTVKEPSEELGF